MGKSGNPAKRAAEGQLKPSSPKDFKKRVGGVFELPSGMVMRLRNPGGMASLMSSGVMPNSLLGIVQKSLSEGKELDVKDIVKPGEGVDPKFIEQMTEMLNKVIILCSVEPEVHPIPTDESDRDDDLLYVDEVSDEDKMFVFQWVSGGTSDLETFRQRHASSMDTLGAIAEAKRPAE